jgi:hypothetical protein
MGFCPVAVLIHLSDDTLKIFSNVAILTVLLRFPRTIYLSWADPSI